MTGSSPLVCVMGVSAVGKTTVGSALAAELGVPFVDADDLHPDANRAKMMSSTPLIDEDRWPWLEAVGARLRESESTGLVVACSALRRRYRDRIKAVERGVVFVHLKGSRDLLASRAGARTGHFIPAALLDSQLATLEPLEPDEAGFTVRIGSDTSVIVATIAATLSLDSRLADDR